jgi:hypothetical protein
MALHIPYKMRNNKFVCSVWVGFMLGKTGIVNDLKKHPSLIEPEDFRSVKGAELIYKGDLKKYRDYIKKMKEKDGGKVPAFNCETA